MSSSSALSRQDRYLQTSAFTCGAATLLNIAADLGVGIAPSPASEYQIWRQANPVWMGAGHPGLEPWGLALAGVRMGLSVRLWQHGVDAMFDGWNRNAEKRKVAAIMRDADKLALRLSGVSEIDHVPGLDSLRGLVSCGCRLAALTGRSRNLHWVSVLGGDDEAAFVHDPYVNGRLSDIDLPSRDLPVAWKELAGMMALNSRGAACVIGFRRP